MILAHMMLSSGEGCKGGADTQDDIELVASEPTDPKAGNTVAHARVSKWDYVFTYGSASIKCTALTRFNDGLEGKAEGFCFSGSGLAIKAAAGRADGPGIYSGANLAGAECPGIKYIGIELDNNSGNEVLLTLDGVAASGSFYVRQRGGTLAGQNGAVLQAGGQMENDRFFIAVPGGFSGAVLIPLDSLSLNGGQWKASPISSIGFSLKGGSADGILIKALFVCNTAIAKPDAHGIRNKDYSYTPEQRMTPFWQCKTMYNEAMAMMQQADGSIVGTLLFVPTQINAVVDVYLKKEYIEGVDWIWQKGTNIIKWLKGSEISYFTDNDLSGRDANGEFIPEFPTWSGNGQSRFGACLYCVSSFIFEKQIAVSYTYDISAVQSQGIAYTEYQGDKLPLTIDKIRTGKDLNVLFYGDSIFSGCDASSMYNREPYMPYMHKLIEDGLQRVASGKISVTNISVGGWTVHNGVDALSGPVGEHDFTNSYQGYDLLILSYGMNNGNTPMDEFKQKTQAIIDIITAANPRLEVVLVSCMNPNPRVGWDNMQKYQGAALAEIAESAQNSGRCAMVDFYAVHKSILKYKTFCSTTGNNINHPNDWLIRAYAQNILAAIIK